MKGLFFKDWRLMGKQVKMMLVFILFFILLFSFTMDDVQFLSGFYTIIFVLLPINCFAYDEMCHFDKFAACSPMPVSKLVLSRYLSALSAGGLGILLVGGIQAAVQLFKKQDAETILSSLLVILAYFGVAILMMSVTFPLFYKFGTTRSRLIMLLVFAVPALLFFAAVNLLPKDTFSDIAMPESFLRTLPFFLAAILLLGLWLSISISIRIVQHKEY